MNTRRQFLGSAAIAFGSAICWPSVRVLASDAAIHRDARLMVVLLRGGLDGLHTLAPYADPGYARLRGALALDPAGAQAAHRLDAEWALHPALSFGAELYAAKQLLPIVAVAPPYWGRSHFDAQDCVENGTDRPHGAQEGWLNRCVGTLGNERALAAAAVMPLMTRGSARVDTWTPPLPTQIDPSLLQTIGVLYARDAQLDRVFRAALAESTHDQAPMIAGASTRRDGRVAQTMAAVAGFLARDDGPRIGFVEDDGWDTHANESAILARKLGELDAGLRAARMALGSAWSRSVIMIVTEFGRTAAVNGTGGTDHGSGGVMFLAGGAVKGGHVGGDWPGLRASALYEGRDVRATTDLRTVFKGVLGAHLGVSERALETQVFPVSSKQRPYEGLIAARA